MPFRLLLSMIACLMALGCASAPSVGARADFRGRTVKQIAIAPISSAARFGTSAEEWHMLEMDAIRQLGGELRAQGFDVIEPEGLRDMLERRRAWDRFEDLLNFPDGIDRRFEPDIYSPGRAEVAALRELAADGLVTVPAIMFAEIVYHSVGECSVDPRDHSRFAELVDRSGTIERATPGPCVVTHVQAKLVDARSATTMWHNRVLRELRVPRVEPSDGPENLSAAVKELVGGNHGVAVFAPR